jgi:hypothetical protein
VVVELAEKGNKKGPKVPKRAEKVVVKEEKVKKKEV